MNDAMCSELSNLLKNEQITSLFQPIVQIKTQQVFGYESLSRGPSDSPLHAALILFDTAERCQLTEKLEELCLRVAAKNWQMHSLDSYLFVNMSPAMLMSSSFRSARLMNLIKKYQLNPKKIVIEISERFPALQLLELKSAIAWLKKQGFLIAIDDLGTGYSGLKLWSDLQPDLVKIDRHFIRDIQDDLIKLEFVRSLVSLSKRLGCHLIAEGVENQAELNVVMELGIELIQGFIVGRPKPYPTANMECLSNRKQPLPRSNGKLAKDLCVLVEPVSPDTLLKDAWSRLQRDSHIFSLPVVQDGRPLGLLHKWRVLELYGSQYGRALFENRSVSNFITGDSLVVEQDSTLDEISQRLIEEDFHYIKQHFIVINDGLYIGLGTTRQLLKYITEERISQARYANPLTGLPGNQPINQELNKRLNGLTSFMFIYVDINDFKPLNDTLGYQKGDVVINRLADMLCHNFTQPNDFVGHIGGDDFVVMTERNLTETDCQLIQDEYRQSLASIYSPSVLQQGYYFAKGRDGINKKFQLSSISIAALWIASPNQFNDKQIIELATTAKKESKLNASHCEILELNK